VKRVGDKELLKSLTNTTWISLGSKKQKKAIFTYSYLNGLAGSKNFEWNYLPAEGTAGGILLERTKMFLRF
jgi:hypothetical protein